jgi:hypothetical protein
LKEATPSLADKNRLVALGASNLTRGLGVVVGTARAQGEPLDVYAALGHGRSYGMRSRVLGRALPGILESGLFPALERAGPARTRGLIMDVGNDVLYGAEVAQILSWVEEAAEKLQKLAKEVVITDLPVASLARLSRIQYRLIRTVIVPQCRLPLEVARERSFALNDGVIALALRRGLKLVRLRPEWYGWDPIHIRPRFWQEAFPEILLGAAGPARAAKAPALRLYLAPPERRWLLGIEQRRAQPCVRIPPATDVYLY